MEKKQLGLKLLELRQSHNLTQKELCAKLNLGRATYSYFETGSRTPDIETLLLIAQYYGVSIDSLVSDKPYKYKEASADRQMDIQIVHHLKAKHIPAEDVLELSKTEFDFLNEYRKLTPENKEELRYLMNYKLRRQNR
jgi:transcriptional regulator with XRE-family HTH domain